MNILVDEKSLKVVVDYCNRTKLFPFSIGEVWLEPGRCVSAKIDYGDLQAKIKMQFFVQNRKLCIKVFKVFAEGININISGFIAKFSGSINKIIQDFDIPILGRMNGDTLITNLPAQFAGVTNTNELMIKF